MTAQQTRRRTRTEVPAAPYGSTRGRYAKGATRASGRTEPKVERREVPDPEAAELVSDPLTVVKETLNYVVYDVAETDCIIIGRGGIYVPKAWVGSEEDRIEIVIRRVSKPVRKQRKPKVA